MNTRNDDFTEVLEVWLQEGSSKEDPYRTMDRALARVDATPQSRFGWLPRVVAFAGGTVRLAIGAMAVAIVAVVGVALASSGSWLGGSGGPGGPGASTSAAPSVPEVSNILGLPPVGAAPSDATPGELVLRFDSSSNARADSIWIYADGRMISAPFRSTPAGVGGAYTGLVVQQLTADGVAFLRSQVAASGLFENDLVLARASSGGYFQVDLRTGDRFVRVTEAWPGETGTPVATAEQVAAIQSINDLFRDQSSWPASAWADDAMTAYVPSSYAVCIGVRPHAAGPGHWTGPVDPAGVWALLPGSAQEILGAGEPTTNQESMHADAGCTQLTTDDARALARVFEAAGMRSQPADRYFVAYTLTNPSPAWDLIWIQFGPLLPNGAAIWLGPG